MRVSVSRGVNGNRIRIVVQREEAPPTSRIETSAQPTGAGTELNVLQLHRTHRGNAGRRAGTSRVRACRGGSPEGPSDRLKGGTPLRQLAPRGERGKSRAQAPVAGRQLPWTNTLSGSPGLPLPRRTLPGWSHHTTRSR